MCCVCNLKDLRMQSRRLHTCGCSPRMYMNCAIARVLVLISSVCIYSLKVLYIMEEAKSDPEADKLEQGASLQPAWLWLLPTVL